MKFKLALFVCLLSQLADAKIYLKTAINSSSKYLYTTEKSENTYKLSQFEIKKDQLQDFKKAWYFKTDRELQLFLKALGVMSLKTPVQKRQGVSEQESKQIWPVKNNWSLEYEKKYATWVRNEIDVNFFLRHKIVADCADVAYSLRWIFARMNYLPIAVTLVGSNVSFTNFHFKDEWLSLEHAPDKTWSEDPVFMASLNYVLRNTSTESVPADTAFVMPSKEFINEGVINFLGHHTQVLKSINLTPPEGGEASYFTLIESTPTRVPMKLYQQAFYSVSELKQFHWAKVENAKIIQTKNPITESEKPELDTEKLFNMFGLSVKEIIQSGAKSLLDLIEKRNDIIKRGFERCQKEDCSENTVNFEEYSTFSSDKRIFKAIHKIAKMANDVVDKDLLRDSLGLIQGLDLSKCNYENDEVSIPDCIQVRTNRKISLGELSKIFKNKIYSSDPRHSKDDRWFASESIIRNEINRKIEKRNKIVEESEVCRNDKGMCRFGSENFYRYSTYELDQELKEDLYRLIYSSRIAKNTQGQMNVAKENLSYRSILFYDSNATSSIKSRRGENNFSRDFTKIYSDAGAGDDYTFQDEKIIFVIGNETISYPWEEEMQPSECNSDNNTDKQIVFLCSGNIVIFFDHVNRKKYRTEVKLPVKTSMPNRDPDDEDDVEAVDFSDNTINLLENKTIVLTIADGETRIYRLEGNTWKLINRIESESDLSVPDYFYAGNYYSYHLYKGDPGDEFVKLLEPKKLNTYNLRENTFCLGEDLSIDLFRSYSEDSFLAVCDDEESIHLEIIKGTSRKKIGKYLRVQHLGHRSFLTTKDKKTSLLIFDSSFTKFQEISFSASNTEYFPFVENRPHQWDHYEFLKGSWVVTNTYTSMLGPVLLQDKIVRTLNSSTKSYEFISRDKSKIYLTHPVVNFEKILEYIEKNKKEEDETNHYSNSALTDEEVKSERNSCTSVASALNENLGFFDTYCVRNNLVEKIGSATIDLNDENDEELMESQLMPNYIYTDFQLNSVQMENIYSYDMRLILRTK